MQLAEVPCMHKQLDHATRKCWNGLPKQCLSIPTIHAEFSMLRLKNCQRSHYLLNNVIDLFPDTSCWISVQQ